MTAFCLYSALLFYGVVITLSSQNKFEFHVGALGPYIFFKDYFSFKTAIDLAVESIHNSSVLQDFKLIIHYKDTFANPSSAIESLIEFKNTDPAKTVYICIIGPASSKVAAYTARLSTIWGPLQVSYGASTPELLDKEVYPRFLTVVPTSKSLNKALIELLNYFKWQRIALAYDVNEKNFFLPTMNALKVSLISNKFNILVEDGISLKKKDGKKQFIERLKNQDVRIVIALFGESDTRKVMCEAYNQGFYGNKIVWITYMTTLKEPWKDVNYGCNKTQFDVVSNGMFVLNFLHYRTDNKKTISNLNVEEFKTQMRLRHPEHRIGKRSPLAFDTTWLLALTLNASLQDAITLIEKSNGTDSRLIQKIKEKMMTIEFEGISGNVKFNDTERFGTVIIRQSRKAKLVDIAQHHTLTNVLTFFANQSLPSLLFRGNIPVKDGPHHRYEVQHYSPPLFISIWIVCIAAVVVAFGLLYFNFKNREIRYIKMSSPHVNNIIIFGGILCYTKVMLDTLDSHYMGLQMYGYFCNVRVWVMSLGFTTSFGAMFSKTWRVHRIFTASKNFRRAVIKNFHLYGLLITLLAVDAILLTMWMILSPYKSDILNLPSQDETSKDEVLHPSIYYCTSHYENYFLITTFGYKGLLLVFGIFLAWETRNIEIKALNDSKYIGISVYNVVILSVVGVIIASLMAGTEHYNIYLALMSTVVILCTAATLGIVFLPKVIGLQHVLTSTNNDSLATSYTSNSDDMQAPCCCCEKCKCRCSSTRKSSIHVTNKFLASSSSKRRKSRNASIPSISVTKPKVSVHINARVSLTTSPVPENAVPGSPVSRDDSLRTVFLSSN